MECSDNERQRLISDGFASMNSIVKTYTYNTKGLKQHFISLNKAFGSHATAPIYFTPILINRLLGIHYHFDQSVNTHHNIPNISNIDVSFADKLANDYATTLLTQLD